MADHGSPTVRRRRLAAELRRLREQSGLTGYQVAKRLDWSASKVSRYELARTALSPDEVRLLLDLYGVGRQRRDELLALAHEASRKGWWEAYPDVLPGELGDLIGLEAEARLFRTWHLDVVPGLLQTEEYARQVNSRYQQLVPVPPGQMERRVQARLMRQQLLTRDPPLQLEVVLDESVLVRRLVDAPVMRAQLERLVEVAQLPSVTVRVLPLDGPYPIMAGSFVLLQFDAEPGALSTTLPDMVCIEHLLGNRYFDDEADTFQYRLAFQQLLDAALSTADSVELMARSAQRFGG